MRDGWGGFDEWRRGWIDGAGIRQLTGHGVRSADYLAGWVEGRQAFVAAMGQERVRRGLPRGPLLGIAANLGVTGPAAGRPGDDGTDDAG